MKILLPSAILCLCTFFLSSCSSQKEKRLLSPNNLESWTFTVDENTDSVFKTPKGALLKIDKGTFDREVELEVKEAYTMRDILLGGLSTTSNGRPLSSGGMIYLNAEDEEPVQFLKPITVALPTPFVNTEMQVFKGEMNGDSINWVDPDSLPNSRIIRMIEQGRQLFQLNCRQCHGLYTDGTGPALAGFRKRGPWSSNIELRKWVLNPARYAATSNYAKDLIRKYGTIMPAFPILPDSLIDAVAAYIENDQNNPYPDTTGLAKLDCFDTLFSREIDTSLTLPDLEPGLLEEEALIIDTSISVNETTVFQGAAYIFNITSTGWYNIDILVGELQGAVDCNVKVNANSQDELFVNLLIPKYRINITGIYENSAYVFDKFGKPPQFITGTEALIIAYNNNENEFYFAAATFRMDRAVSLNVELIKGDKSDFEKLLRDNKVDGNENDTRRKAMKAINNDLKKDSLRMHVVPCPEAAPPNDSIRRA